MKTMNHSTRQLILMIILSSLLLPQQAFSQNSNEAAEPTLKGEEVIDLLEGGNLEAWKVPSQNWYFEEGRIVGSTGEEKLNMPEWLYTREEFSDFEFTCELRLSGDTRRNTGIYFRVRIIQFETSRGNKSYEAPSGYEYDAAYHNPGKRNFRGTLGDWYARPRLRIFPDQDIISQAYKTDDWNRMTIRARGNRIEYWLNGSKIMDYQDDDPKASRKGFIGFQIHDGSVMKVEYRNIRVLPIKPVK